MANLCDNDITIKGKKEGLDKLEHKLKVVCTTTEPYYSIFPEDNKYSQKERETWDGRMYNGMYILRRSDVELYVSVDSAWAPPETFFQKVSEYFKVTVELNYFEGGCDFSGSAKWENGEEVFSTQYTYLAGVYAIVGMEDLLREFDNRDMYKSIDKPFEEFLKDVEVECKIKVDSRDAIELRKFWEQNKCNTLQTK